MVPQFMASRVRRTIEGTSPALRAAIAGVLAVLVLSALSPPGSAIANGAATEVFRGRQAGYEMALGVLPDPPKLGHVHFSVTLADAETSVAIDDAEVTIVAHDEAGEPTYQARALNTPQEPLFYEANITFKAWGSYGLEVSVDSPGLGPTVFSVPLEIEPQSIAAAPEGSLVFLGLFLVLVGGAVYVWYSARRQRRRSQSA